jgi:uncharacterized protein (TIGR00299 family) protein
MIAYFDCFCGASGDMILGALLDAGLSAERLKEDLSALKLSHYEIRAEPTVKKGIAATRAHVHTDEEHHHHHSRRLSHIRQMIEESSLSPPVKEKSIMIFYRLAEAEARVHGVTPEEIHFHEVGAADAIIDVVGAVSGLEALGITQIFCSPLHVGTGTVSCAHGILPVPAPATALLIKGKPIYSTGLQGELLTPTGAAILTSLAADFGPMPPMTVSAVGYGAGSADRKIPNLLRVFVGKGQEDFSGAETDVVAVIETGIDDMSPQIYDFLMEKLLKMGAKDVFICPVQMKKNRPAVHVTVLCDPMDKERVAEFLFRQTTTIGLRWRLENRIKVVREIRSLETPFGSIRVKVSRLGTDVVNISPEYEDCKKAASEHQIPLKTLMDQVRNQASGI